MFKLGSSPPVFLFNYESFFQEAEFKGTEENMGSMGQRWWFQSLKSFYEIVLWTLKLFFFLIKEMF